MAHTTAEPVGQVMSNVDINPLVIVATEDFTVTYVPFTAGGIHLVARRNPRRTGLFILPDPAQSTGIAVSPQSIDPATAAILPLSTSGVSVSLQLYRAACLADWYVFAPLAGTVTVYDFFRLM